MRIKTIKLLVIGIIGFSVSFTQAQSILTVKEKSGINTQFDLTNVRKISFTTCIMSLSKKDATTAVYTLNSIQNLNFSNSISEVPEHKDNAVFRLTIYPNPTIEQLTVSFECEATEKVQLQVLDMQGKLRLQHIFNSQAGTNQQTISVSELSKGLYICRLINSKGVIINRFIRN
jgi:hypothetical protein